MPCCLWYSMTISQWLDSSGYQRNQWQWRALASCRIQILHKPSTEKAHKFAEWSTQLPSLCAHTALGPRWWCLGKWQGQYCRLAMLSCSAFLQSLVGWNRRERKNRKRWEVCSVGWLLRCWRQSSLGHALQDVYQNPSPGALWQEHLPCPVAGLLLALRHFLQWFQWGISPPLQWTGYSLAIKCIKLVLVSSDSTQ